MNTGEGSFENGMLIEEQLADRQNRNTSGRASEGFAIRAGLERAFIDGEVPAENSWTPSLVYNDYLLGEKVFVTLARQLEECSEFRFSIAFITLSGIQLLKPVLRELQKKGIPGKILTTDYLHFSDPEALDFLDQFENIDLRIFRCQNDSRGFHTKGYFFRKEDCWSAMIGSSNLTAGALTSNEEWNTLLFGRDRGAMIDQMLIRFDALFYDMNAASGPVTVPYSLIRDEYRQEWQLAQRQKKVAVDQERFSISQYQLTPNPMQAQFAQKLKQTIEAGRKKGLLVSATGTGKTYASAFALRELRPRRILFLVHREQIARQAMDSYKRVFGRKDHSFGLVGGGRFEKDRNFVFSTVQTLSKEGNLKQFEADTFDFIVIDEVHRAGAASYQKIFDYFKSKFWLGMSATPSRMDGVSIYELFDHNIISQIGLRTALEEDLLSPFHYYALCDLKVDDETITDPGQFNRLIDDQRIEHILNEAKYYGYSGSRVKGLTFVSSVKEASALSARLNKRGLRTMALSGADSQEVRERAIERLVQHEDNEQALDYLITVDIFNEGVDIPAINQVLLLRPTKSAIVFVQQLGRGLRKAKNKEFVTVLDFIGLYANNFIIPEALLENRSGNKDGLRRFVLEGNRTLPGASSVYFDEISRSRIFKAIEDAKLNSAKALREGFLELKERLGRVPMLTDFDEHALDPLLIFSNNNYPSYPDFLRKQKLPAADLESIHASSRELDKVQLDFLRFVSTYWVDGKRPHELLLIKALMNHPDHWQQEYLRLAQEEKIETSPETWVNLLMQFQRQWLRGTGAESYPEAVFLAVTNEEKNCESGDCEECRDEKPDLKEHGAKKHGAAEHSGIEDESIEHNGLTYNEMDLAGCSALQILTDEMKQTIDTFKQDKNLKEAVLDPEMMIIHPGFARALESEAFRFHLADLIEYGLERYRRQYAASVKNGNLCLNEKYSYMSTFRLLDFPVQPIANNVGGYIYNELLNIFPVYINYDKAEDIAASTQYEDHFLSPTRLIAFSKSGRSLKSKEIIRLQDFAGNGMKIPLFVRKNTQDDLKEFYYLGLMKPTGSFEPMIMKDGKTKAVRIEYELEQPVRADLYDYLTRS